MIIRKMENHEINEIRNIDRSEIIEAIYYFKNKTIVKKPEFYDIRGWNENELSKSLEKLRNLYEKGGTFLGVFENEQLVGVGVLETKFIGSTHDTLQLAFLHVSNPFRKKGIGAELLQRLGKIAERKGAKKLYISATPSENTINFYLNQGCRLVEEVNQELYEEEPEDIHLELEL
ncbi:MAG: GNAT family N-acetyltransferase [Theionarchaea archaeon]|nr:GNAT family N-acetyltransferase [Theionarchaea archaeon]